MATVGNIKATNGSFTVTDAKGNTQAIDLGTLLMMLNIDRTNNLDKQIEDIVNEIQERNALIEDLTFFMSECRKRKANREYGTEFNKIFAPSGRKCSDLWDNVVGVDWTSVQKGDENNEKDTKWDANINAIKGKIDTLNNDSQMSNIKLQNLLEKRSNAFEMATTVMNTNNDSVKSILRNL